MPTLQEAFQIALHYHQAGQLEQAEQIYRQILQAAPNHAEALHLLGVVAHQQGHNEAAIDHIGRAIAIDPAQANFHNNLGSAWQDQGKLDEAIACFHRAIQLKPDHAEAHWNRSFVWLLQGDLERGWPEFEWRWQLSQYGNTRPFSQPRWHGDPLKGQTILLHAEQGLGDTIQFVRYAEWVKQRGGTVLVGCQRALVSMLARCRGIDQLVAEGETLPPFDVQCPLLSLAGVFQTRVQTIPAGVPYLFADPALVESWHQRLARFAGFKVGINWQGNPRFVRDRSRSIPLAKFAPLAEVPGISLISLQKGFGSEQLAGLEGRFPVSEAGPFNEQSGEDRAAILANLDLLVTSDTAVAHLAGAMGVPVWVALPYVPDWRWLLDRDDSPWYPTMRLFRQTSLGDWSGVFERIKAALARRLHSSPKRD